MTHDRRHGGPYDRGRFDSYYRLAPAPHYYEGPSYRTPKVEREAMTPDEVAAYHAGYEANEADGDFKDWG